MRINRYIALATGLSRRTVDRMISVGRVNVNGLEALAGQDIQPSDTVTLDNRPIGTAPQIITIILNKPTGYVCSRSGQGSKTIYDLLPPANHKLKPVGRLDKDSSGLLLLTNNGKLAHKLTHPSFQKEKVYEVELDKPLTPEDKSKIETGVTLEDGKSKLRLSPNPYNLTPTTFLVHMNEGRNRQIRRTFAMLNYQILVLHRIKFEQISLGKLESGKYRQIML